MWGGCSADRKAANLAHLSCTLASVPGSSQSGPRIGQPFTEAENDGEFLGGVDEWEYDGRALE